MKSSYSTDLTDAEWECLELHVPPPNKRGRPKTHNSREILNAIFYVLKSGCAWRLLPRDFPPWESVYWWFRRWRIDGTFERLNAALRERLRVRLRRNPQPSAGVVHRTPKPTPEKVAMRWAEEWSKEGWEIDWQKLLPRRGFEVLPRRWVVERTFSWLSQNRRMSKDYERLCATAEAFVYVAMRRLMVRRLARA
jgi:transposase